MMNIFMLPKILNVLASYLTSVGCASHICNTAQIGHLHNSMSYPLPMLL